MTALHTPLGCPHCFFPNPSSQKPQQSVALPSAALPDAQGTLGLRGPAVAELDRAPTQISTMQTQAHLGSRAHLGSAALFPLTSQSHPSQPIPTPLLARAHLGLNLPPPWPGEVPGTAVPLALGRLGSVTSVPTQERTSLCLGVGTACILLVQKPDSRP